MRWAPQQRQEFITKQLAEKGDLQRADLVRAFGISMNQATADIAAYQRDRAGSIVYDGTTKRYKLSPSLVTGGSAKAAELDFRQRLIVARGALGWSPQEIANRLLTPLAVYEQWECGKRPTPGAAVVAAELLTNLSSPPGRPFPKGTSGNPGGAPPKVPRQVADPRIRELITAGLTQSQIAKSLGLSNQTVSRIAARLGLSKGRGWRAQKGNGAK